MPACGMSTHIVFRNAKFCTYFLKKILREKPQDSSPTFHLYLLSEGVISEILGLLKISSAQLAPHPSNFEKKNALPFRKSWIRN